LEVVEAARAGARAPKQKQQPVHARERHARARVRRRKALRAGISGAGFTGSSSVDFSGGFGCGELAGQSGRHGDFGPDERVRI
jgi:hypothetical protein